MDTVWAVVGIIVGVLFAGGLSMIGSPTTTLFARCLLWASALLLGAACIWWELMTDLATSIRVIVGLIVGAFVFVVVPETIRRMRPSDPPSAATSGTVINQNVTSHGQSGGITAHTVNPDRK